MEKERELLSVLKSIDESLRMIAGREPEQEGEPIKPAIYVADDKQ